MKCRLTCSRTRHQRRITVRLSFLSMTHVAFRLESAKQGEDGRVGEVLLERFANLRDGRRAFIPQDRHHIELTFGERHVHVQACYEKISNTRSETSECQLGS